MSKNMRMTFFSLVEFLVFRLPKLSRFISFFKNLDNLLDIIFSLKITSFLTNSSLVFNNFSLFQLIINSFSSLISINYINLIIYKVILLYITDSY